MLKQLHDINCVFEGFDGIGAIYISGITGAKNLAVLQKHNIKAVVCAARSGFLQYDKSVIQDYLYIPADDYEQFDLSQYFQKAYDFIEKNRKKTNVLVHCMAGISRSVTLVVAYLIKKYDYSMDSILSLLKRKRSIINPNEGFLKQLKSYENTREAINGKNEVKNLINDNSRRENYFSVKKSTTDSFKSKSIQNNRRRTLSKESKDFLNTLKQKDSGSVLVSYHKRKTSTIDQILSSSVKGDRSRISFKKPEFYSSELSQSFNFAQVQKQVTQLQNKLQTVKNDQQNSIKKQVVAQKIAETQKSLNTENQLSQMTVQIPLAQKLQLLKANLISEYKKNKQKAHHNFGLQNEQQQRQLDLAMATKILKISKLRRYGQKRPSQLLAKFSTNS